ncbi:extracellular solute-binding protein [Congregibacter litoralis]|uniref:ABC-type dipeptide transport system, periplasmic component n=1 Tax=Congregibacter litoralis KT71 TaxID=314285 RepID=A4A5U9_9GAMM|nr:extracellular solute-binding protein [Congregibacter litoralis]EAQ98396.2 ABC-type dipeptide transport system, periplasmic component [Congregibacter litoralis KT71]
MKQRPSSKWLLMLAALFLAGCGGESGGGGESDAASATIDNTAEVEADYAAEPDFYRFKTLDDLPADLVWENGADLPEIGSPEAKKGGTRYIALPDFPRTLRTAGPDSNGAFRPYILDNVVTLIAHLHPDEREFYPALAESWALDPETSTVYVKLDPAATWSDGVPVTTDDFFFMFWFYKSEYIRAPWYNNWYGTQYTNITRYDDRTFSITSASAKPDYASRVLELHPRPRHHFKELGEDYLERYQWRFTPTTGAYVLRDGDLKKGRSIVLTRNKDWWAKDKKHFRYRYNPDRVQFNIIRDTPKRFEAFKRGDIDQFGLALSEYWYEKLPDSDPDVQAGYIAKSVFYNEYPRPPYGLWMNTSQPLLDDLNVRLGVQHASNWQLVIDQYFRGDAARLKTANEGFAEFNDPSIEPREFDISKAQAYFAAAGFTERGPDGILVNAEGQKLAFTLSTGYENLADVMTILKQEAQKAGLELRIEILDSTTGWKKVQEKQHEIHLVAFGRFLEMYPRYWEHYHSDNAYDDAFLDDGSINPDRELKTQTNNLEAFADFEMDGLIDRYRASQDKDEMVELSHQILNLHHEHASFSPGWYQPSLRLGHWRWIRYPDYFNHRYISTIDDLWVHWIDTDLKKEVLEARKSGKTFPPKIQVYDQWKP